MNMQSFGIIGFPLGHSFSKRYFSEKFQKLHLNDCSYSEFPLEDIAQFPGLLLEYPALSGLNVTFPYKTAVIPFLTELSPESRQIGAVNCIKITNAGGRLNLKGYNTDVLGFEYSLKPLLQAHHQKALILGTGGAARAMKFVLDRLQIQNKMVSRSISNPETILYKEITEQQLAQTHLIVNATPLGMFPDSDTCPDFPYHALDARHLLYDLVYNPTETLFLQKGREQGCTVKNGLEMLHLQADASWEIWTNNEL